MPANQTKTVVPATQRGEKTVQKILDTTLNILQTEGYGTLTTNHIATRSDIKVGSIYRFFANKEAIVIALMARWHASILDTLDRYLEKQPASASFVNVVQGMILVSAEQEYTQSAAYKEIWLASSTVPELQAVEADHQKRIVQRVVKTYRRHAKGHKTNAEIAELAVFLYGLASAALSQVSEQKPKNRVRQMQWIEPMVKALIKNFETKS